MKKRIIILGSGHAATSIASILAAEGNDITLVDEYADNLPAHQDRFDIRTVAGHPSHPDVLERADAENADILIAMQPEDDSNLVAAQVAHTLFNIPIKIVRLEAATYLQNQSLFSDNGFPIDHIISPQKLVADSIALLIDHPGTMQFNEFGNSQLAFFGTLIKSKTEVVGQPINALEQITSDTDFRIAAIYRDNRLLSINSTTRFAINDEVYCLAKPHLASTLISALHGTHATYKNIFIAGGGNCGMNLARLLESRYSVKLIERNPERAAFLSRSLSDKTIVLRASANDEDLLRQEGIENSDVFCSSTSDDEDNIMSAVLARSLGVKCVMSLVIRPSYVKLVEQMVGYRHLAARVLYRSIAVPRTRKRHRFRLPLAPRHIRNCRSHRPRLNEFITRCRTENRLNTLAPGYECIGHYARRHCLDGERRYGHRRRRSHYPVHRWAPSYA